MKRKAAFFVAFEKVEKQEDGTMLVSGVASSEAVDADGETITSGAMKAAMPDYMKFGAVREMHQPIAAGTALKCWVDDAGVTHIDSKIVDPTTVMKIEEEVLKGFSVGGKVTSRDPLNKTIITGIRLTEISVVDRPANPEAIFKLAKIDGMEEIMNGNDCMAACVAACTKCVAECIACAKCCMDCMSIPGDHQYFCSMCIAMCVDCARCCVACAEACEDGSMKSESIEMAKAAMAAADELMKAGAKYSKTTKAAVKAMRMKVAEMSDTLKAFDDMKDDDKEEEEDKEDLHHAAASEAIQKAAGLESELVKARARISQLEAQPAPPKGVLNANSVVAKTDDHSNPDSNDAALMKQAEEIAKLPPEEQTRLLIKAIHAGPIATR